MTRILHTIPLNDMFGHDTSNGDNCSCGPEIKPIERDDGDTAFHVVHKAFDGREHDEPDHDRENCPDCMAS